MKFSGVSGPVSASFSVLSTTSLRAIVPAAAISGPITVTNGGGSTASADVFTVNPKLSSFNPSSGPVGTLVSISGSGFDGTSVVKFNGTAAGSPKVLSGTLIKAAVPAGATTGTITVTTDSGGATTIVKAFKVTPGITAFDTPVRAGDTVAVDGHNLDEVTAAKLGSTPVVWSPTSPTHATFVVPDAAVTGKITLTSLAGTFTTATVLGVRPTIASPPSPASGVVGTVVTLSGKTFGGTSSVKFAGWTGPVSASFTVLGPTTLRTKVPSAAITGPITVTNAGGSTPSGSFTVSPKLTSFSPSSGAAGSTVVTVAGSGFQSNATVSFGGVAAGTVNHVSATKLQATVPNGSSSGQIVVGNPADGTQATSASSFTVTFAVTGIAPAIAKEGATVTITGVGLTGATGVAFNGISAAILTNTGTQITVNVPAGDTSGTVTVAKSSLVTAGPTGFTRFGLDGLSPATGPTGTQVTVTGAGFDDDDTVTLGGDAVPFDANDVGTALTFTVPNGSAGGAVSVADSDTGAGTVASAAGFTVTLGITGLSANSGTVGDPVTITGIGLGAVTGVNLNGTAAVIETQSATQITTHVPAGSTTGKITATDGTSTVSSAGSFTVTGADTP